MRTFRSYAGPFKQRVYFQKREMEQTALDELQKTGLLPTTPEPIRVERFIEKRFEVTPVYDETLPDGVLGYTEFGKDGVRSIFVTRALSDEKSRTADRRINTTLAHEAGHGLLHSPLFVLERKPRSLFGEREEEGPKVLCREVTGVSKEKAYDGHWWEYQANQMIGALLLPRPLVEMALQPLLSERGMLKSRALKETSREEAILTLTDVFDVNPAVARIRIQEMYPPGSEKQLLL